jgi:hypothetical protein
MKKTTTGKRKRRNITLFDGGRTTPKKPMLTRFSSSRLNSLSSFIRQLSYYSFKRLSDRRRSAERRSNQAAYIVFSASFSSAFSSIRC